MAKSFKNIVIITEAYPYVGGEQFLYNEFLELSKQYESVIFFPLNKRDELVTNLPGNYVINDALSEFKSPPSNSSLLKYWRFTLQLMFLERFKNKNGAFFFKKLAYHLATVKQAFQLQQQFETELPKLGLTKNDTYLSTWMNVGSLVLAISKHKKRINRFSFRVNGFDIFDQRREGEYMPFQAINYKLTSNVIVLSQAGYKHIKAKNIWPEKLSVNYSGLYERGENTFNENQDFTIVSCSNVIPLKRVEILAKALSHITFNVNWTHFGDGVEMPHVKAAVNKLPSNIEANIRGAVSNAEVIDFYLNNSVNLFVHPSETEGLGMAIIEAQSFGIPAIGCDTGGVPEIINESTGKILDVDLTPELLAEAISNFKNSDKNTIAYRQQTKQHFLDHFNIVTNNQRLVKSLES